MKRKNILILCISIEQMKGHKDSANEAIVVEKRMKNREDETLNAERRMKNREDRPSKQKTTASTTNEADVANVANVAEKRMKNREDKPSKQNTTDYSEKRSKYIHDRPQCELFNYLVS